MYLLESLKKATKYLEKNGLREFDIYYFNDKKIQLHAKKDEVSISIHILENSDMISVFEESKIDI